MVIFKHNKIIYYSGFAWTRLRSLFRSTSTRKCDPESTMDTSYDRVTSPMIKMIRQLGIYLPDDRCNWTRMVSRSGSTVISHPYTDPDRSPRFTAWKISRALCMNSWVYTSLTFLTFIEILQLLYACVNWVTSISSKNLEEKWKAPYAHRLLWKAFRANWIEVVTNNL